ncbi:MULTISPECIES: hypothetical protein [Roseivirga]|uniref:Uncharacterized protein n=1 Tax=Roseivirga thermotolerans TaxID=1758176 RepID=A0ABQ3I1T5_9BACT|nr:MULTISPECIES: hypothetical protein [Roseivirga]MEC7756153.1 hypothetical protein [Bacteroidota bacterium]GHE50415.1 hypothetical protein GCM10011340_00300 [Roseivirga thermotolerans]|tara:strand:- start:3807 stop:4067 length:261 start_codon:yes stop_codon:yes gene_type:complete
MNEELEHFFEQPLSEQIEYLYRNGAFQLAIRYYGYKVNLYLLENIFVEVFYNHKLDRIESIQPLDYQHSRMKFYADQIQIGSLLKA